MAEWIQAALGLSVGATNLAAVSTDGAVTRRPMLTLYPDRQSEVGVPAENPNLAEPGLVTTDFVNRVGDPQAIVAADGSPHRAQDLLADGLRALGYAATGGRPLPEAATVTHPAHWSAGAVDALRGALARVPEWSSGPLLVSDAAATLSALQAHPGVPARGILAVCDLGGSGTTITLVDAANDCQPIDSSVRHPEFCGELIDQALVNHVLADLSSGVSLATSATSRIGPLAGLRGQCRRAKEQLSVSTTTELRADRGDIQLSRADLDDMMRPRLDALFTVLREALDRNEVSAELVAVAAAGGGANIPGITTGLSQRFRVPVITMPRPQLAAAVGAALLAERGPAGEGRTAFAPGPAPAPTATLPPRPGPPPARSEAGDSSGAEPPASRRDDSRFLRSWWVVILGTALLLLAAGAVTVLLLGRATHGTPPTPSVTTTPASTSVTPSPTTGATTVTPSSAVIPPPPVTTAEPTTATTWATTTPQPTTTTTTVPTTTTTVPTTTTTVPTTTTSSPASEVPHIPEIPHLPQAPHP